MATPSPSGMGYTGSGWSYAQRSPSRRRPRPKPTPTSRFAPTTSSRRPRPKPVPTFRFAPATSTPRSSSVPAAAGMAAITQRIPSRFVPSSAGMASSTQRIPARPVAAPSLGLGAEVFRGSTESETAAERMRRLLAARLRAAVENARLGVEQQQGEAESAAEANRRAAYQQALQARAELSGTGRGFSPRFTSAVREAIERQAVAAQAANDSTTRRNISAILSDLRSARAEASEQLSESEVNALVKATGGQNLSRILEGGNFRTRGR
jgi:hypothetical protein